jgi:hypothetical protein
MAIERQILSRTAGNFSAMSQVCTSNTIVKHDDTNTTPFSFDVPVFVTQGATFQYYVQNTNGISTNLNNIKSLIFGFSANTNSLTGTTKMKHDIYRIEYGIYTAFTSNNQTFSASTVTTLSGGTFPVIVPVSGASDTIRVATQNIISAITIPFYTVIEDVSGSTFLALTSHTLNLPQKIKPTGQYTQDLFSDKSQYFIDSKFMFEVPVDQTKGDVRLYSGGQLVQLYDMPFSSTTFVDSASRVETITGGTFSGATISGASFTYFVPPKKADIFVVNDAPAVQGSLRTFAPIFSFKNVEDGDYYNVQVNYNTGDTSFTGETTTFRAPKQPGNAEFVRTYAVAVSPNEEFLYRIGNSKELINMFGVKQFVTTWSEFVYAISSNDGNFVLSGYAYNNILGGTPIENVAVTINVLTSNSTVDLGSDVVTDPNVASAVSNPLGGGAGTSVTVLTDVNGFYSFGRITGGFYSCTAQHPTPATYPNQTTTVYLTTDTEIDFVFSILWGNTTVDFQQPYTFI